jgi:cell division protein FtsB
MEESIIRTIYFILLFYLIAIIPVYTAYFVYDILSKMLSEEKRLEMCDIHIQSDQTDEDENKGLKDKCEMLERDIQTLSGEIAIHKLDMIGFGGKDVWGRSLASLMNENEQLHRETKGFREQTKELKMELTALHAHLDTQNDW